MIGVVAGEGGVIAREFLGDPSASGHEERVMKKRIASAAKAVSRSRYTWHD
jgi:hypothetical protein